MISLIVTYSGITRPLIIAVIPSGNLSKPLWGLDFLHSFNLLKLGPKTSGPNTDIGRYNLVSLNLVSSVQLPKDRIQPEEPDVGIQVIITLPQSADVSLRDGTDRACKATVKDLTNLTTSLRYQQRQCVQVARDRTALFLMIVLILGSMMETLALTIMTLQLLSLPILKSPRMGTSPYNLLVTCLKPYRIFGYLFPPPNFSSVSFF